jgi:hypothetical protein
LIWRSHSDSASSPSPTRADQTRQHLDHAWRADAAVDLDRQSFLGELVRHRQALELLTVGAVIEHKVIRPYLVRAAWRLRSWSSGRHPLSRSLARHLQARCPPQPMQLQERNVSGYLELLRRASGLIEEDDHVGAGGGFCGDLGTHTARTTDRVFFVRADQGSSRLCSVALPAPVPG